MNQRLRRSPPDVVYTPIDVTSKIPLIKDWQRFSQVLPTLKEAERWWGMWPKANIGGPTGPLWGVALDIDPRHGGYDELDSRAHKIPHTVTNLTGGGGAHYLFRHPGFQVVNHVALLRGVDVRGDGGQIVLPPSVHESGKEYAWEQSSRPDQVRLAPLPEWLLDELHARQNGSAKVPSEKRWQGLLHEGERNDTITSMAGELIARGVKPDTILEICLAQNAARCQPPLKESEILGIVGSVSRYDPRKVSANYVSGVLAERNFRFYTGAEIANMTSPNTKFVWDPYIPAGALTEVVGKIKAAGKTTLVTHMCRAVLDGLPFLGTSTTKSSIIYLTEQGPQSFRQALARADLLQREDFFVLYWRDTVGISWLEIARAAIMEAKRQRAGLLVVDTLPRFAGIRGEGENTSGAALEAIESLQHAAADGLGVIVVRHERKSGGEIVDSGRGSSAFGGAADVVLSVRRGEGNTRSSVRILEAISRFDVPEERRVIDLENGKYRALGNETQVAVFEARTAITAAAPQHEGEALRLNDLLEASGIKRATGQGAIEQLMVDDILNRTGSGKKGDPYRFWKTILPNPDAVAAERIQGISAETPHISMAERNGRSDYFHFCRDCGADVNYYGKDGEPWCDYHGPDVEALVPAV